MLTAIICCTYGVVTEFHDVPKIMFDSYAGVPPDQVELKVTDWPLSIVGLDGLIVGVDIVGFTVTVTV